jgi:hypothetical protein
VKGNEADELRHAEVQAQQATAHALSRVAHVLEAPAREEHERELASLRHPPRRLFGGERGTVLLLRSIPGFADLWERHVPDSHIREARDRASRAWQIVRCMCGEHSAMQAGNLAECPGDCGRWFLHAGRSIRVKRFETEPEQAEAA